MDKGMRKANKRLENAKRCVDMAYKRIRKMEQLKNAEPEPTIVAMAKTTTHDFEVVKIQKGLFKVEKDGKIVPKNFKSITKAKEWILKQ